jgi:hypothetical protein
VITDYGMECNVIGDDRMDEVKAHALGRDKVDILATVNDIAKMNNIANPILRNIFKKYVTVKSRKIISKNCTIISNAESVYQL